MKDELNRYLTEAEQEESLPFPREKEEKEEKEDETAEIRKIFNNGRMEMLFSLVHEGRLTLEDAQEHFWTR